MTKSTAIIILNWNSGEMTAECIRSLNKMDIADYGIIIVDNGSHDNSVQLLRQEFPEITILPQSRNLGFAAGCNVGITHAVATGFKYTLLLNNDTVVDSHFLSSLLDQAKRPPKAVIVSPKIYFYDLPDRFWWSGGTFSLWQGIPKHIGRKEVDTGQYDVACQIDWATGCAVLVASDCWKELGLFDEQLFGNGEDLDFSLRARHAGLEVWFEPRAKLWHKEGVDYRKNVGEYARKFTGTRNLLWIMHKHASRMQWISFLPNFLVRYVAFYILLSLWRKDYRSAKAVLEGMSAFIQMQRHPESSPLPADLAAPAAWKPLEPKGGQ